MEVNTELCNAIAQRLTNLLNERGLNQYYLFKKGGIPRATLSDVFNAKRKLVSVNTIYQICSTLDITLEEFFSDNLFNEVDD